MPNNLSTYEKTYNNIRFAANIIFIAATTGSLLGYLIERNTGLLYLAIGSLLLFGASFCYCQGYRRNDENISLENNRHTPEDVTTIGKLTNQETLIPQAVAVNYYSSSDENNIPSAPPMVDAEKII